MSLEFECHIVGPLCTKIELRKSMKEMDPGEGSVMWGEVVQAAREMQHERTYGSGALPQAGVDVSTDLRLSHYIICMNNIIDDN